MNIDPVIPFIGSTTRFGLKIIELDKLKGFAPITKFIYSMLHQDTFRLSDILVNVNDFDDWDYVYKLPEKYD